MGFFEAHSDKPATQICAYMSNTLPNYFVLVDNVAQRVFDVSSVVIQRMVEIVSVLKKNLLNRHSLLSRVTIFLLTHTLPNLLLLEHFFKLISLLSKRVM